MTAQTPPAGPATTDRALIVDAHRWARYHGWVPYGRHGWTDPAGITTNGRAGTAVTWDEDSITVYRRRSEWAWDERTYRVASVREAVDILVAVDVLPAQMSSAYRTAQAERAQADRDARQAYADRARLRRLADAVRRAADEYEGHQAELPQDVVCCPGCDIASSLSAALDAADTDRPAADVDELIANVRLSLASATTDDERAEAIEMLLEDWYAAWPDSAVTSPHYPLAGELVRLLAPWAAQVQQLQGPLAGYALLTTTANAPTLPVRTVLDEIAAERARQDRTWGEQNHPDGTGPRVAFAGRLAFMADVAADMRRACKAAAGEVPGLEHHGPVTWRHILLEEVYEALAEDEPGKLRAELVQVAAVAVAWIGAIDRRGGLLPELTGRPGEPLPPLPDTAYPPDATPLDPACPGDPHCRAGHRCDHHRSAAPYADDVPPNAGSTS